MTTPPEPPPAPPPPPPPPPGPGMPPPGYANNEEKTWALVAHFGGAAGTFLLGAVFGWIAPLVALVSKGKESPTVRAHAIQALNFQITWAIVGLIGWITICIGIGVIAIIAAYVMGIVFGIIAGVKATEGRLYNYPAAFKFIK